MKKYLALVILLTAGCSSYIPEEKIPGFPNTKAMGEKYPYIVIDGQRLEYQKQQEWYFYENTDIPALWLEYPGELGVPQRRLATVSRYNLKKKKWYDYKDGQWVERRNQDELISPEKEADFYIDNVHSFVK